MSCHWSSKPRAFGHVNTKNNGCMDKCTEPISTWVYRHMHVWTYHLVHVWLSCLMSCNLLSRPVMPCHVISLREAKAAAWDGSMYAVDHETPHIMCDIAWHASHITTGNTTAWYIWQRTRIASPWHLRPREITWPPKVRCRGVHTEPRVAILTRSVHRIYIYIYIYIYIHIHYVYIYILCIYIYIYIGISCFEPVLLRAASKCTVRLSARASAAALYTIICYALLQYYMLLSHIGVHICMYVYIYIYIHTHYNVIHHAVT